MNYNFENCNSGFQLFGAAIIEQAIKDWMAEKFYFDTIDERIKMPTAYKSAEDHKDFIRKRSQERIDRIESFFFSDWFDVLSPGLEGYTVLERTRRYYKNEEFPRRHKIFTALYKGGK